MRAPAAPLWRPRLSSPPTPTPHPLGCCPPVCLCPSYNSVVSLCGLTRRVLRHAPPPQRQVCEARGLTREMVFVLGRMGSADRALRLIVEGLRDVAQVGRGATQGSAGVRRSHSAGPATRRIVQAIVHDAW